MKVNAVLLALVFQAVSRSVLVLYSQGSALYPLCDSLLCQGVSPDSFCRGLNYSDSVREELRKEAYDVVMDFTESVTAGLALAELAETLGFTHLYSARSQLMGRNSISLWLPWAHQGAVLEGVLSYYGWSKVALISSSDLISASYARKIDLPTVDVLSFLVPTDTSEATLGDLLGRGVKSTGRSILVLNTAAALTLSVLRAAKHKNMLKAGYVYFILIDSVPDTDWIDECDGCFYVTPTPNHSDNTRSQLLLSYYKTLLSTLVRPVSQFASVHLYLWNAQANRSFPISELINNTLSVASANVTFPGGATAPPSATFPVAISISNSLENPTIGPSAQSSYQSSFLALRDVNTRLGLIPNFEVVWRGVEYGYYEFKREWALERISPSLGSLGVAVIAAPASSTSIGLMSLFADLNVSKPLIGAVNTAPALSSSAAFPDYVRVALSDSRFGEVYAQIIKYYGWTRCVVLYTLGDVWSEELYHSFKDTADLLGIEIANENRGIDDSLSIDNHTSQLLEIVASRVRIMVFIVYNHYIPALIEGLYGLGLRRGDAVFVAIEWLTLELFANVTPQQLVKMQELLQGSIMVTSLDFRGSFGRKVHRELMELGRSPENYDCLYYDAALLAAYALRYLILRGLDYEDTDVMIKELRTAKFVGCSGLVYIEEGSNDRARMAFQVYTLKQSAENGTWSVDQVLIFDPESTQIFKKTGEMQWPDGSNTTPLDTIPDGDCPNEKQLARFTNGQILVVCVGAAVFALTSAVTLLIWRRWWRVQYPKLVTRCEISMEDYIMFMGLAIEFCQIIAMGPSIDEIAELVVYAIEASSLDFSRLLFLAGGMYWIILDCIFAVCIAWVILFIGEVFDVYQKCGLSTLESISERFLPFIGHSCFLPIVSQLLEVFICDRSYDNTFSGSVLAKDCHSLCWGSTHSLYVLGSSVLLIGWVPVAIFTRPLWQELQGILHVKTQPGYLLLSTVFQIALIVLNKTLKRNNALSHGAIYIAMVAGMIAWLLRSRPHNYSRANLWHVGMYCAALWMGVLSLVNETMDTHEIVAVLLVSGWSTIAIGCFALQTLKYKSLLYRKPDKDTRNLFRFGFALSTSKPSTDIDFHKLSTIKEASRSAENSPQEFTLHH